MKPRKKWLTNIGLFGLSMLFTFALVETALRLAGIGFPDFYKRDANSGYTHNPGTAAWFTDEGRSFFQINDEGLRGPARPKAKPPGVYRIAVLGDSFTEAKQVPVEQTFWSVMERELNRARPTSYPAVEVISFGVAGYGTASELQTLRHRVWEYAPDLVVLAFFTGNDVRNNSRALEKDPALPYFLFRDGQLALDDSFRKAHESELNPSIARQLRSAAARHSRFVQLLRKARSNFANKQRQRLANADVANDSSGGNPIYRPPATPEWTEAWRVTEGLLLLMRDDIKAKGAGFLVATLSNDIQANPDRKLRESITRKFEIADLFYPDQRIKKFCDGNGIDAFTLAPLLQAEAEKAGQCLHGFTNALPCAGHWNERGHEFVGQVLSERIREDHLKKAAKGDKPRG